MSQDISRKSQDNLTDLLHKIQSNLVHDVDDLDDQIRELKGVLNETLGGLPFKFAILLVVFLNFLYTSYDAFFAARITSMIANECYCDPTDQIFYRVVMLLSTIFWILFLFIYGFCYTCGHQHLVCACHSEINTDLKADKYVNKTHRDLVELLDVLEKKEKKFQAQLRELVTTKFLDDDHCESIRQHYYCTSLYWKDTKSSADPPGTAHKNGKQENGDPSQAKSESETPEVANRDTNNVHLVNVNIENVPDNTVEFGQAGNGQNNTVQAAGFSSSIESRQAKSEPETPEVANSINTANRDTNNVHVGNVNTVEFGQAGNGQNNTVQAAGIGHGIESGQTNNGENAMEDNNVMKSGNDGQNNNTDSQQIEVVSPSSRSDSGGNDVLATVEKKSTQELQTTKTLSRRWYCFMLIKVSLILLRFVFRLLIVPLLQLQLFNDYAWYCLLNNIVRNYCETETNKYYIGLDHSLVNYCVYILLLIALLFSFLINWFPKGIPQVVLLHKAGCIMVNKRGQFKSQFQYKKLENECDDD